MMKKMRSAITVLTIAALALSGCAKAAEECVQELGNAVSVADLQESIQEQHSDSLQAEFGTTEATDIEEGETPRMLCIDGEIYYDTGRTSDALRCGLMDHVIDSSVKENETPTENNQSNFGTGYGYQRGKGQVHVNIDDAWCIFQASEAYRLTVTNGNNGEVIELERGHVFWEIIEKYQNLDVTAQGKQVDSTGYSYCLRLYDAEDNLMATVTPMGREVNLDGEICSDNGYGTVNELYLALDALFEEDLPEATATEDAAVQEKVTQEKPTQGENGKYTPTGNIDVLEDVHMSVSYATEKGANLVLMNSSDKDMQCGEDYELQMLKDGEWHQVDYIIDNGAFHAVAYSMPKNEPVSMCIDWAQFHGILPAGQYRIVKTVMDFRGAGDYTCYRLAAEFDI